MNKQAMNSVYLVGRQIMLQWWSKKQPQLKMKLLMFRRMAEMYVVDLH